MSPPACLLSCSSIELPPNFLLQCPLHNTFSTGPISKVMKHNTQCRIGLICIVQKLGTSQNSVAQWTFNRIPTQTTSNNCSNLSISLIKKRLFVKVRDAVFWRCYERGSQCSLLGKYTGSNTGQVVWENNVWDSCVDVGIAKENFGIVLLGMQCHTWCSIKPKHPQHKMDGSKSDVQKRTLE